LSEKPLNDDAGTKPKVSKTKAAKTLYDEPPVTKAAIFQG
jgi:hypothetical protein